MRIAGRGRGLEGVELLLRRFPRQEYPMRFGIPEMLIILAIVVLIFGASRLPELVKGIGRGIRNFKDATRDGDKSE